MAKHILVRLFSLTLICLIAFNVLGQSPSNIDLIGTFILNVNEGGQDIIAMTVGSSELRNITNNEAVDIAGSISPDGSRIAFMSNRDGDFEIYASNLDGSTIVQLTDDPATEGNPSFSPDGTQIVFTSDRGGALRDLYVMDNEGNNVNRITTTDANEASPQWSPDGQKIAFFQLLNLTQDESGRYRTFDLNIGVVSPDGSDMHIVAENVSFRIGNISFGSSINQYFEWSPDSTSILYRSAEVDSDTELYLVDVESGATTQLTDNDTEESGFTWTDTGEQIVFSSFDGFATAETNGERLASLYIMDNDGGSIREIISMENRSDPIQNLIFVPEAQKVVFEHWSPESVGSTINLWSVNLEGTELINLTNMTSGVYGTFFYISS